MTVICSGKQFSPFFFVRHKSETIKATLFETPSVIRY